MSNMTPREARAVIKELNRRALQHQNIDTNELLFPKQRRFVEDKSRLIAAKCSRRAGKSHGAATKLVIAALKFPGSTPLYVTMARERAKQIIWPALEEINERYNLEMDFKLHTGEVRFPNGSIILISGAGSRREVEKCRGLKYPVVIVDEAQVFSKDLFDYMVDEVFAPAVLDYRGQIMATGTPNAACAGAFFDITTGAEQGWSIHEWTLDDNPFLFKSLESGEDDPPFADMLEEELELICKRRGWTRQHSGFLREYRGMWVRDDSDLVFAVDPNNIYVSGLDPTVDWEYVLGVDVGYEDPMAFVVLAYSEDNGQVVVVESYTEEHMIPSQAAAEVQRIMERYPRIDDVVVDAGGAGKGYAEEMKQRWDIPVIAAKKTEKTVYLEFLNGDLRTGALKVLDTCRGLVQEMSLLQWNSRKKDRGVFDYDKAYADHQCDALLYAWRLCRHHEYEAKKVLPAATVDAQYIKLEKELEQYHLFPEDQEPWWKTVL